MGRAEPSIGRPPPSYRKAQRAKKARATLNNTIPALLTSSKRARDGVAAAELIVDPPAVEEAATTRARRTDRRHHHHRQGGGRAGRARHSKRRSDGDGEAEEEEEGDALAAGQKRTLHVLDDQEDQQPARPLIRVLATDTLTAASILSHRSETSASPHTPSPRRARRGNVAILNMASPLRAGGGFASGATSQEEFLCMRTTLLPSLREEFYRLPELGGVWSPDVLVFRDSSAGAGDLPRDERFWVDVVSAAALRFPEVDYYNAASGKADGDGGGAGGRGAAAAAAAGAAPELVYADAKDATLLSRKIRAVLRILQSKSAERVVLGAWGCGAYGNPVGANARAWRDALLGLPAGRDASQSSRSGFQRERWSDLREVVFAISQPRMAEEFARFWGPDVKAETPSVHSGYDGDEDDGGEDSELEEVRGKIAQLETQIANAKTPLLKEGLLALVHKLSSEMRSKAKRLPSPNLHLHDDEDAIDDTTDEEG